LAVYNGSRRFIRRHIKRASHLMGLINLVNLSNQIAINLIPE
jgi:hypothetical protein